MVFLGDKKFACATCIKGHRSSTCTHTTRPLFEIRAKGRPVSQCEHCRELRKTKQVHVKCECDSRPLNQRSTQPSPTSPSESVIQSPGPSSDATAVITTRKGARKVKTLEAATATFPNGIQDVIEAAALLSNISSPSPHHPQQDVPHSIPSPGNIPPCQCSNSTDGVCNCCTPRYVPKSKRTPSVTSDLPPPTFPDANGRPPPPPLSLSIPLGIPYGAPGTSGSTPPSTSAGTCCSSTPQHHAIDGHHIGGGQNDHHSRHAALYSPYTTHVHGHNHSHGHGHRGGFSTPANPSPVHGYQGQHLQLPIEYRSNNTSTSSLASVSDPTNPSSPYHVLPGPSSHMQLEPRNEWDGLLIPLPTVPSPSPTGSHHGMPLTPHSTPLIPGTPNPPRMDAVDGSSNVMEVDMLEGIFAKYAAAGPSTSDERFGTISGLYPDDLVGGDGTSGLLAAAALLGLGRVSQPGMNLDDTSNVTGNAGGLFDGVVGDPNPVGLFDSPPPPPSSQAVLPQQDAIMSRGRPRQSVTASGVEQMYHTALGGSTSPSRGTACDGGLSCHCWNMSKGDSSGPVCTDESCGCCNARRNPNHEPHLNHNNLSRLNPEFVGGPGSGFAVSSDRDSAGAPTSSGTFNTAGAVSGPSSSEFGTTFGQIVNHQLTSHNPFGFTTGANAVTSFEGGGGGGGGGRRNRSSSNASSSGGSSTHSSSVATSRASVVLAAGGAGGMHHLSPTSPSSHQHQHQHQQSSLSRSNSGKSVTGSGGQQRKQPRAILPKPTNAIQIPNSGSPGASGSTANSIFSVGADGHISQGMMYSPHFQHPQQQQSQSQQMLPPSIVVVHPDDGSGRLSDLSNMVVGGTDYFGMTPTSSTSDSSNSVEALFQSQGIQSYTSSPTRQPSSHSRSRSVGGGGMLMDRTQFDANQARHQRSSSFGSGGMGLRPDPAPSIELIVSPPSPGFTG